MNTLSKRKKPSKRRKKITRKRRPIKRRIKKRTVKRKRKIKRKAKKKPFGGYGINFSNRHETLEQVFGSKPIAPSMMTKLLWRFIKKHRLGRIA